MNSKKINKKDLKKLLDTWRRDFNLIVPVLENEVITMDVWDGKDTAFIDWYRNTVVPPKANFLPPGEKMISFEKKKDGIVLEIPRNGQRQIIFGVRPCDARSIAIIDDVFTETYEDTYYLSRRNNTIVIGLSCNSPYDSCFCTSLNINPVESAHVDLLFTDIGDDLLIEEITERGKGLLNMPDTIKKATKADTEKGQALKDSLAAKVTKQVNVKDMEHRLQACFNDREFWEKAAAKCIGCGICTFLCPTCFCFDINDEMLKKQGARYRSWDSCSFKAYTRMPMENPREERWRRVRQKVCHKYQFLPANLGVTACTGCGRCIRLCPVNWDITQVLAGVPQKEAARSAK